MHTLSTTLVFAAAMAVAPVAASSHEAPPQAAAAATATAPDPVQALQRMGAYMGTLETFEVTSESSLDLVMADDQRIDLDGVTTYKVRRPDAFVIDNRTDRKQRRFYFDGRRFTVYAPGRGFYASAEAPGTIHQILDTAYDQYGIALPLEDLFHWGDPARLPKDFQSAEYIGPTMVGGVQADQFAFRQEEIDWQIWIQQGDRPLPLKIVIIDKTDPTRPEFSARLSWNTSPRFDASTFAFSPASADTSIAFHKPAGASQ